MKDYGQYKRLIKFISSFVIVAAQVLIYYYVWMYYNTRIVEFPFFSKRKLADGSFIWGIADVFSPYVWWI